MAGKNSNARSRMEELIRLTDPTADVGQEALLVDVVANRVEAFIANSLETLSRFETLRSRGLLPEDGPKTILLVRQQIEMLDAAIIRLRTSEKHTNSFET